MLAQAIELLRQRGAAPFLGTLKRFGAAADGYLSFPLPGWSLAVDMPAGRPGLRSVLVRAALDPAGIFRSDLGRRLGLVDT
jgi:decaprenylphospho-beta-D-ribofuranose 2-oxidase